MGQNNDWAAELETLLERLIDGEFTASDRSRLNVILAQGEAQRRFYRGYMRLHHGLEWRHGRTVPKPIDIQNTPQTNPEPLLSELSPLPSLSTTHYPLSTTFVGGPVFSYMVASVVLCLMLLGAWAYIINHDHSTTADKGPTPTNSGVLERPQFVFVGRVSRMNDCQWSDEDTQTVVGAAVPLNREYALASGLLEITYKSGARVILEGPCTYKVESSVGGYLAVGKLTARIEERGEGRGESAKPQAVFSVKTPTAIVTDLGTEFGVEVDENGDTVSHVFQGSISVQGLAASAASGATKKVLHENESIRVSRVRETHHNLDKAETVRFTHPTTPPKFTRRMPHQGPIKVYGTGQHCECGVPDPNWYIASARNDPNFKPQHAVTTAVWSKAYITSRPGHAVWISTDTMLPRLPDGVVYTFRTRFQLNGSPPRGLELRGAFAVDNHITAIRLNGRQIAVPEHGYDSPFLDTHPFSITDGFVEGTNVLEFDVFNGILNKEMKRSWMALYVELEAIVRPETDQQDAAHEPKKPSDGGKEDAR